MKTLILAAATALATLALPVAAQAPGGGGAPLKLIVPFTPGTGIDIVARTVGPKLSQRLGRPVVVENRVGASGNIGTEAVVRAPADGNTLLVSVNTLVMNRGLYPQLPFDPVKDLVPVSLTSWGQLILVAHPSTGFKTAADLVAAARARPGRLNYASPGVGTPHHMSMELFKQTAGVYLTHIPYRGTGPALNDVLAGRIEFFSAGTPALLPHIKSGALRCVGVGSPTRISALPNVQSVSESYPGFVTEQWYGIHARAGTPRELILRMQQEVAKALKAPDVVIKHEAESAIPGGGTPEEYGAFVAKEQARWRDVVIKAGIKAG